MSHSYTLSETFTITHARHIASRMAADFRLMRAFYGEPSEEDIEDYLEEIAQLLAKGYLATFELGFRADGKRVVSLFYEVRADGTLVDNRAGGVQPGADIEGAHKFSHVTYSDKWSALTVGERAAYRAGLPVQRTAMPSPEDGDGYWTSDSRSYAAGGAGVQRRRFFPR